MVCKRSLYCWKNGPCASDQTRKQIWEENIKFRESLRNINQSDHYWSFQICKNKCLCLEEDAHWDRPFSRKYRSASLQRLHDVDCASVAHDCNGLKFRNCFMHCPFSKNSETRADTPVPQSVSKKDHSLSCLRYPFRPLHKSDEDKSEYCHRYNNSLLKCNLKPSVKTKCLSQLNLSSFVDDKNKSQKKLVHSSCEDIHVKSGSSHTNAEKKNTVVKGAPEHAEKSNKKSDCEIQTDMVKPKKLKPLVNYPQCNIATDISPLSRTTRKMMLAENKKVPFVTYGCNNRNLDIGSKRTHNVLASKLEVYPNALLAKEKKRDWIMKYIESEKEFQKKCFPDGFKRRINHSSVWSLDLHKNESKPLQKKTNSSKHLLPLMSKPLKKLNSTSSPHDFSHHRNYRKPQIYFY